MRRDAWVGTLLWWSCQSPGAHTCGLLNHLNSFCGGMFKLNSKFDAHLLLYLISHLSAMVTQYTCSVNSAYHPHWLLQWSCHCSHMCIPVHSPWLPGHTDVAQTVLIILKMGWLFLDRPLCIYIYTHTHMYICIHICTYMHTHIHIHVYIFKDELRQKEVRSDLDKITKVLSVVEYDL